METIFDHHPTPFEMHHLGYTEEEDSPITDEVRANVLSDTTQHSQWLGIACLMGMRYKRAERDAYLRLLPEDDPDRKMQEEMNAEWDCIYPQSGQGL